MAPPAPGPDEPATAWLPPPPPAPIGSESTWFLGAEAEPTAAVSENTVDVDAGPWTRGTDDLLPGGRRGRRLALRRK
ncbi:MAG: hypothetical protein H0U89_01040 [Acidimicrobiia bacterium]|nr:hypothetical protein [Acidimicrobiia bacterium]